MTNLTNKQLVKNLRHIAAWHPNIAAVQTVGVIEDCLRAANEIERLEKEIHKLIQSENKLLEMVLIFQKQFTVEELEKLQKELEQVGMDL